MAKRFESRSTRARFGDGYSTEQNKRGGGVFRSEASIAFTYKDADESLAAGKEEFAKLFRSLKANKDVKIYYGRAMEELPVFDSWRKTIKYRVRDIAVQTTALMKEEMLRGIGGRIETGTMKGAVRGRTEKSNPRQEVSRVGWLDLWYKYFGFQEEGTSTGIKPMRSILRATVKGRIFAAKELSKMARDLRSGGKGSVKRG